jgi:signal transduction histidine kinase
MKNIAKHALSTQVKNRLAISQDQVLSEIRDNGVGFPFHNEGLELTEHGHLGLVETQERANAICG